MGRPAAALSGWIAAVPALVYSYALVGSIKELTALPLLMLMGALIVLARENAGAGIRGTLPFAVAGAGALGAIGISASPWVALFGLALLLATAGVLLRARVRIKYLIGFAALTVVLGLPTLAPLSKTLRLATRQQGSNAAAAADPGNLLRPLRFIQAFGVWLGESHRLEPKYLNQTHVLIGFVMVCALLGVFALARRRAWGLLAFAAISLLVWGVLTHRGTEWIDAKLLMLLSPVMVLLAFIGAFATVRRGRLESLVLAGLLTFSVLASDALAYHSTGLAPTGRYEELAKIGRRFAGDGPTFLTDFDEYAMYFLRDEAPDAPGFAYRGDLVMAPGVPLLYGHSYDIDEISLGTVEQFPLIVMRRSPGWSRPPSNYALVFSGDSYDVWRRDGPAPLMHEGLGTGAGQPVAEQKCSRIRVVAAMARRDKAELTVASRPPNLLIEAAKLSTSGDVLQIPDLEGHTALDARGPARIEGRFRVPSAGDYRLWLGGNVDRPLHVSIDGRLIGSPSYDFGGDQNKILVGTVQLSAGTHQLRLLRGGGGLQPGDNASNFIDGLVLEPLAAEHDKLTTVEPGAWRSLCGHEYDWLEIS
jgi:hypothetical protein